MWVWVDGAGKGGGGTILLIIAILMAVFFLGCTIAGLAAAIHYLLKGKIRLSIYFFICAAIMAFPLVGFLFLDPGLVISIMGLGVAIVLGCAFAYKLIKKSHFSFLLLALTIIIGAINIAGIIDAPKEITTFGNGNRKSESLIIEVTDKQNINDKTFLFPITVTNKTAGRIVGVDIDFVVCNADGKELLCSNIRQMDCNSKETVYYDFTVKAEASQSIRELYQTDFDQLSVYIVIKKIDYNDLWEDYYYDEKRTIKEAAK